MQTILTGASSPFPAALVHSHFPTAGSKTLPIVPCQSFFKNCSSVLLLNILPAPVESAVHVLMLLTFQSVKTLLPNVLEWLGTVREASVPSHSALDVQRPRMLSVPSTPLPAETVPAGSLGHRGHY